MWLSGNILEAEITARNSLILWRKRNNRYGEGVCLPFLGLALVACGREAELAELTFRRSILIWRDKIDQQGQSLVNSFLAQYWLWLGQPSRALSSAQYAWDCAQLSYSERDFIRSSRLHGEAALVLDDIITANERLYHSLKRTRAVNFIEEELPALIALAKLHRLREEYDTARELLDQVWDAAERGPYPLFHADALNVLAQIERDQNHLEAAIAAATKAYQKAWCDGPPYAYHYGLTNARKHLQEFGAPEPQLPPFDPAQHEPMPEVELNPKDEFYVEETTILMQGAVSKFTTPYLKFISSHRYP